MSKKKTSEFTKLMIRAAVTRVKLAMDTDKTLTDFYADLRAVMEKHNLIMDCMDEYNRDGWCGQTFILRSKKPVNGRYPIYTESLSEFVENASRTYKGGEQ